MAGIKELLEDVLKEAEGVSLGIDKNINDYLDTGNLALNKIISDDYFKGYPLGRIVELYGDPSTGKSMLIYQAMANWQKKYEEKAVCILDDTEDVFTEFVARIVGLDGSKVLVVSSETVEDHFETVFLGAKKKQSLVDRILSRNKDFKIIVALDSVAHLSTRHEKEVGLDKSDLSKAKQFLDYIQNARSKSTYKMYRIGIKLFEEYYGKNADEILEERKQDVLSGDFQRTRRFAREMEKFYNWLVKEGYSENTARTNCQGILQFFRFYGFAVALEPHSKISRTTVSSKTWIPSIEDLRKMFKIADLRAKVILSLGLDVAWRVNDFLQIKKNDIDLTKKPPIPIEKITQKQKILSSTFISSETVELLKAYIPTLPKNNDYLFPSKLRPKQPIDSETVNKILKDLTLKAKIKIPKNKRFTFHSLRKRFLSTAYTLGIDSEISKLLVGKSIGSSVETYLYDVKLQDAFKLVRGNLKLSNGTFFLFRRLLALITSMFCIRGKSVSISNPKFSIIGLRQSSASLIKGFEVPFFHFAISSLMLMFLISARFVRSIRKFASLF